MKLWAFSSVHAGISVYLPVCEADSSCPPLCRIHVTQHQHKCEKWESEKKKKKKLWKPSKVIRQTVNTCVWSICIHVMKSIQHETICRRVSEGKNLWVHTNFLRFVECHLVLLSWWCCHLCMLEGDMPAQRDVLFNNCLKTGHCGNWNVTSEVGFCGILWYILQWICIKMK